MLVADKSDLADVNFGTFFHHEGDANLGRRNRADLGAHGGELPAMLGQQFFDRYLGLFDLGGVVLALRGQTDLAVLEAIQDVALGNRIQAQVFNFADGGTLFDIDVDDPALGRLLPLESDVFEVTCIPERIKVALQGRRIINVPDTGEDPGFDGFRRNSPLPMNNNTND